MIGETQYFSATAVFVFSPSFTATITTYFVSIVCTISFAEVWVFESQPRQNQVVKTGIDSSTAKRSAIRMSVTDLGDNHYKRMTRITVGLAR